MPVNLSYEAEENCVATKDGNTPGYCATVEEVNQNDNEDNIEQIEKKRPSTRGNSIIRKQCYSPHSSVHTAAGIVVTILLGWLAIYVIIKKAFLPNTDLFKICLLVLCSYSLGVALTIIKLPHVAGLLIAGSVLRTVGYFDLSPEYETIAVILKYIAISVTICKAGLALDVDTVWKCKWPVFRYSLFINTAEAIVFAAIVNYVFSFPWLWAIMFAYVICATSSGPFLNEMSHLKTKDMFENERMKSTIENSAYLENTYSIAAFTVCLNSIAFTRRDELIVSLSYGILDLVMACLVGLLFGSVTAFIPHKNDEYLIPKRCLLILINGSCTYFGCRIIGFPSGGALACFVTAATSTFCWKKQGWSKSHNPALNFVSKLWNLMMEPLLFGLVGTQIDMKKMELTEIGTALWIFLVLVFVKIIVGFLTLIPDSYNNKEKLFIIFSWMPKATVQVALGPQVLIMLNKAEIVGQDEIERAQLILKSSVLSVIFFTLIFSIVIKCTSEKLLVKKSSPSVCV